MARPSAARPLAVTATSPVVDGLQLELSVWDAAYGRGPVKARLTLTNRGKAKRVVRPSQDLFKVDAHFPQTGEGGACVAASRVISFAASGGADRPLAPGASTTVELDLSAAGQLVPGWYWLSARYEVAAAEGAWNGKLETPGLKFTVAGTPGSGMCARNPGWDRFGPAPAPAAKWDAADPSWKAGGSQAAALARFKALWPTLRSVAAHPHELDGFDELVRSGAARTTKVPAATAAARIRDAIGKRNDWEVGSIDTMTEGEVWHVFVSSRMRELFAYIDADDGRLLMMWLPPEG